jgi:hypothetical protein
MLDVSQAKEGAEPGGASHPLRIVLLCVHMGFRVWLKEVAEKVWDGVKLQGFGVSGAKALLILPDLRGG